MKHLLVLQSYETKQLSMPDPNFFSTLETLIIILTIILFRNSSRRLRITHSLFERIDPRQLRRFETDP
jgi:hypothetical protein